MPLARINNKILHFMHIPKTGGSSVTSYLRAKGPVGLYTRAKLDWADTPEYAWARTTPQHMQFDTSKEWIPENFSDATFAVIRDPVERLLSEYRYRVTRHYGEKKIPPKISTGDELTLELDWNELFHGRFDDWVRTIFQMFSEDPYVCDNHVRPQAEFISQNMTVFRFEDGVEHILKWIDKETDTPPAVVKLDKNESIKIPIEISPKTRCVFRSIGAKQS